MAIFYQRRDGTVELYTKFGELSRRNKAGHKRTYWALTAVRSLSDVDEQFEDVTRYELKAEMLPAIEKIFAERKVVLQRLEPEEIEHRLVQLIGLQRAELHDYEPGTEDFESGAVAFSSGHGSSTPPSL